jgi:T-complex protein 1 subunit beta
LFFQFFQLFADRGVMAIEHADFDGIERLALVTGGEIVSTFGNPDLVRLGRCDLIEQVCNIFSSSRRFSYVFPTSSCFISVPDTVSYLQVLYSLLSNLLE